MLFFQWVLLVLMILMGIALLRYQKIQFDRWDILFYLFWAVVLFLAGSFNKIF